MRRPRCIALCAATLACAGSPLDVSLRGPSGQTAAPLPAGAPVLVYDLVVAAADPWGRGLPADAHDSLCDRVAREIDGLIRGHGFEPVQHDARPDAAWVRLTLIAGPERTVLWAEARGSARSRRESYAGPADPVRPAVEGLLARMLADFGRER